ncbi:helix-turn-helix domain-containing protein [Pseudomonas sp. Z4-20]|uniref:helix-turn-helix domain-containing protein n=1 Tax=Pseudomonas sp. Z4-20 TaxID=2817414 RepID=UPI003DA8E0F1
MTLISITKAAVLLGIGRTTAYRLAKEGRIPCVRSFGPLRVHAERLQALVDAEADASVTSARRADCDPAPSAADQVGAGGLKSPSQVARELDELLKVRPKNQSH